MKKLLAVGTLVTVIGIGSLIGYADSPKVPNIITSNKNTDYSTENKEEWFKERMKYRRAEIQNLLKDGKITKEEANNWEEHLDEMEKYHEENGFVHGICDKDDFRMGMRKNGRGCRR